MVYGKLATWDNKTNKWDTVESGLPLPFGRVFEPLPAAAVQTSTASYVLVAAAVIDTLLNRELNVSFLVSVITHTITAKAVGSIDGVTYYDITANDATLAAHSAVGVDIAGAASDVFLIPAAAAAGFRYFGIMIEDKVGGTHGVATVTPFAK